MRRLAAIPFVLIAAAAVVLHPSVIAAQRFGAFEVRHERDAMTDRDRSVAYTNESEPTVLRTATLAWRCNGSQEVELIIGADAFLNSGDAVPVQWRFDHNPSSGRHLWSVSTTGTSAFAPPEDILAFTVGARRANHVVLRVTDYRGVNYDLTFNLSGATAAIGSLACGKAVDEALQAQAARAIAKRAQEAQAKARIPKGATLIGSPEWKTYFPLKSDCWKGIVDGQTAVYFVSVEEAKKKGYTLSALCR